MQHSHDDNASDFGDINDHSLQCRHCHHMIEHDGTSLSQENPRAQTPPASPTMHLPAVFCFTLAL
ncbi:hypothetical protein PISMIDRAFT_670262 [Pisolithus microcarpus 441]|uniref:Uncharacterized protein n=1 Tax=Pisolithus microcarpus 441 TaxID=765257 RepID=A0A0C9ZPI4_9AGAM|nr:hypothetical protein PISMIDRAFT_670262 [Pisolithus microcarpus 441]